jgi:hypothetical protein
LVLGFWNPRIRLCIRVPTFLKYRMLFMLVSTNDIHTDMREKRKARAGDR